MITILKIWLSFNLVVAIAMLSFPARAADKIDFTQPLMNIEGKAFSTCLELDKVTPGRCAKEGDLTLETLALTGLQLPEKDTSGVELVKRGALAQKIYDRKSLALSVDEIKLVKDQIVKLNFNPLVILRAYAILDPASVPKPDKD